MRALSGQIALDDFPHVLPDAQGVKHLHVRKSVEEDNAVGDPVGVVHFLDGFLASDLRHVQKIPKEAVMQPILVDGRELMSQGRV